MGKEIHVLETINGTDYVFNRSAYRYEENEYLKRRKEQGKYTRQKLREELSNKVNLTEGAIKQWYGGYNGPSDIKTVKAISDFFNIDYLQLLIENGRKDMTKDISVTEMCNSEEEVIRKVYSKIVEQIYFEAGRFKNSNSQLNLGDYETFENACRLKCDELFELIDKNSLIISGETRTKLFNTVSEVKMGRGAMEVANGRWLRLNPLHYDARTLFMDGELCDEEREEKVVHELWQDLFGKVEKQYCAKSRENLVYCGFHKDSGIDELKERTGNVIDYSDDVVFEAIDEENPFGFDYDDIYRSEYIKTIVAVFREDFPQYFGN